MNAVYSAPLRPQPASGGMRFADVQVGMEVLSLRTEFEVQTEFARNACLAYVASYRHYIGQRGVVLNKDMRSIVQVQFKDQNIIWFPASALRKSVLKKGRFTPYHEHELAESDLSLEEVGVWICAHCALKSVDGSLGKPWICIGKCERDYMLCRPCVFNAGGSGQATLWMAAKLGNHSMVEELLAAGHDPNEKKALTTWTPVHTACRYGKTRCLRLLLEAGGDPDFRDIDGRSPTHLAAREGHVDCMKYLLAHGAKTNLLSKTGKSARLLANARGNHVILKLLDEHDGALSLAAAEDMSQLGDDDDIEEDEAMLEEEEEAAGGGGGAQGAAAAQRRLGESL